LQNFATNSSFAQSSKKRAITHIEQTPQNTADLLNRKRVFFRSKTNFSPLCPSAMGKAYQALVEKEAGTS
jgi:hypothetical protein